VSRACHSPVDVSAPTTAPARHASPADSGRRAMIVRRNSFPPVPDNNSAPHPSPARLASSGDSSVPARSRSVR
jgi:hypothetical protein